MVVLECSYAIVRFAPFSVRMILSCVLDRDLYGIFVVNPSFELPSVHYGCIVATNARRVIEPPHRLTAFRL